MAYLHGLTIAHRSGSGTKASAIDGIGATGHADRDRAVDAGNGNAVRGDGRAPRHAGLIGKAEGVGRRVRQRGDTEGIADPADGQHGIRRRAQC